MIINKIFIAIWLDSAKGENMEGERAFDQGVPRTELFHYPWCNTTSEIQFKVPLSTDQFLFSQCQGYVPTA